MAIDARAKAEAERAVCGANEEGFRTGVIRPGNPIYGQKTDPVIGAVLRMGNAVSWIPNVVQNFVNSRNVALAHLQFEAALAQKDKPMPGCAGRTFNVTDPGPPIAFTDAYETAVCLSTTGTTMTYKEPLPMYLIANAVESYCLLLAHFPFLTKLGLREPTGPVHFLQPSVFTVSKHTVIDDSAARKSVAEGGIGYKGVCTTIEGLCEEVLEWNREHKGEEDVPAVEGVEVPDGKVAKAGMVAKGAGL